MVDTTQGISAALRAYADAQRTKQPGTGGGDDQVGGFAQMVKNALNQAVDNGQSSESQSMAAIVADKADLNQVVSAVSEAELTLDTVVAVRDRVLDAYREILRMPI